MPNMKVGKGLPRLGRLTRFARRFRAGLNGIFRAANRPKTLAVAAILKNEAPYILEWVAYHRVVGAHRIVLFDNESEDGSPDILKALADAGIVEAAAFPGRGVQFAAMKKMVEHSIGVSDLVALIDMDEFLYPANGGLSVLPELNRLFEDRSVGAVAVNWAIFGSSGQEEYSARGVLERFTRRPPPELEVNHHYKTILRPEAFAAVVNPHAVSLKKPFRTVNTAGESFEYLPPHGIGLSADVNWTGLRINHYIVKSREEFFAIKLPRGRASVAGKFKSTELFNAHDRNEIEDPVHPVLLDAVAAEIERLSKIYPHQPRLILALQQKFAPRAADPEPASSA